MDESERVLSAAV